MQQPSIGRIVHYHQLEVVGTITNHGPVTRTYAAIITEVLPRDHGEEEGLGPAQAPAEVPRVSLRVFYPDHDGNVTGVPWSADVQGNHWTWPPRN